MLPLLQRMNRVCLLLAAAALLLHGSPVAAQEPAPVTPASEPALTPLTGIRAIAAGDAHTCAITTSNTVKCWGSDSDGQLGNGAVTGNQSTPVDVVGLASVDAISTGGSHTCALLFDGTVRCWGSDFYGEIGEPVDDLDKPAPVSVPGLTDVQQISAGGAHTCALIEGGTVKCWGLDQSGQLGEPSNDPQQATPVSVPGLTNVVEIAAGGSHTCALLASNTVKCWGRDAEGQVGEPVDNLNKPAPVGVPGLTDAQSVVAGRYNTCVFTTFNGLRCWGWDAYGQVGDGTAGGNQPTPKFISSLGFDVLSVVVGGYHTCAVTRAGGVKCWGRDNFGEIGDGTNPDDKPNPVDVLGQQSGVAALALGTEHSCALMATGGVKCWGRDSNAQIGDGPYALNKQAPVDVLLPNTCFKLTRARTGSGATPAVSQPSSPGCPPDHFLAGATLLLQAVPNANQRVQSWSTPASGSPGDEIATLSMPSSDTTVTVTYATCRALTRTHSGGGGDPIASPPNSAGCASGKFAAGESIVLNALPNASQRVKAWTGATSAPAAGSQVNSLIMPDADKSVDVEYEACLALTTSHSGQGQPLVFTPGVSQGCLTGGFAAGQQVVLQAQAAAGWVIAAWSGTADDASTAAINTLLMPSTDAAVGVVYEPAERSLYLPAVRRQN